jgi:hypothetical protein
VVYILPSGLGTDIWQCGALLVSLFNMKWECYVRARGVEESKFPLFSVVFPVRKSLQDFTLGGMFSASSL